MKIILVLEGGPDFGFLLNKDTPIRPLSRRGLLNVKKLNAALDCDIFLHRIMSIYFHVFDYSLKKDSLKTSPNSEFIEFR